MMPVAAALTAAGRAFAGAGSTIGAADALDALFLGSVNEPDPQADDDGDHRDHEIIHCVHNDHFPLRAYSALSFLFVLPISVPITMPMAITTARPIRAATTFREAGAVISVPTVYTRYATT